MSKTPNQNIYISEKLKEVLARAEAFEKKTLEDREEFQKAQVELANFKNSNPDATYEDAKEMLNKMQELHYYSFLLEQNLKNELIRAEELSIAADILNIDLDLNEDQKEAMKYIRSGESSIFGLDKERNVVLLDSPSKAAIETGINMQKSNPEILKKLFNSIVVADKK